MDGGTCALDLTKTTLVSIGNTSCKQDVLLTMGASRGSVESRGSVSSAFLFTGTGTSLCEKNRTTQSEFYKNNVAILGEGSKLLGRSQ